MKFIYSSILICLFVIVQLQNSIFLSYAAPPFEVPGAITQIDDYLCNVLTFPYNYNYLGSPPAILSNLTLLLFSQPLPFFPTNDIDNSTFANVDLEVSHYTTWEGLLKFSQQLTGRTINAHTKSFIKENILTLWHSLGYIYFPAVSNDPLIIVNVLDIVFQDVLSIYEEVERSVFQDLKSVCGIELLPLLTQFGNIFLSFLRETILYCRALDIDTYQYDQILYSKQQELTNFTQSIYNNYFDELPFNDTSIDQWNQYVNAYNYFYFSSLEPIYNTWSLFYPVYNFVEIPNYSNVLLTELVGQFNKFPISFSDSVFKVLLPPKPLIKAVCSKCILSRVDVYYFTRDGKDHFSAMNITYSDGRSRTIGQITYNQDLQPLYLGTLYFPPNLPVVSVSVYTTPYSILGISMIFADDTIQALGSYPNDYIYEYSFPGMALVDIFDAGSANAYNYLIGITFAFDKVDYRYQNYSHTAYVYQYSFMQFNRQTRYQLALMYEDSTRGWQYDYFTFYGLVAKWSDRINPNNYRSIVYRFYSQQMDGLRFYYSTDKNWDGSAEGWQSDTWKFDGEAWHGMIVYNTPNVNVYPVYRYTRFDSGTNSPGILYLFTTNSSVPSWRNEGVVWFTRV